MIRLQKFLYIPFLSLLSVFIASCGVDDKAVDLVVIEPAEQPVHTASTDTPAKPPLPDGVEVAVECWPIASRKDDYAEELFKRGWCGGVDANGIISIDPEVMKVFDFNDEPSHWQRHSKDIQCYLMYLSNGEGAFSYIHKNGQVLFTDYPYDAECAPFGNGVVVSYKEGKAVFYNEKFLPIHRSEYELADTFHKHLAKVCAKKPDKQYEGEHFKFIGGQCGYIGTDYQVVVPIVHPYESTPRPTGGKYDGDDPTGRDALKVQFLYEMLETDIPLEAVFLRRAGCHLGTGYKFKTEQDCSEKYPAMPLEFNVNDYAATGIEFRLEDQTYWRGLVIDDGGRWPDVKFVWHKIVKISSPTK